MTLTITWSEVHSVVGYDEEGQQRLSEIKKSCKVHSIDEEALGATFNELLKTQQSAASSIALETVQKAGFKYGEQIKLVTLMRNKVEGGGELETNVKIEGTRRRVKNENRESDEIEVLHEVKKEKYLDNWLPTAVSVSDQSSNDSSDLSDDSSDHDFVAKEENANLRSTRKLSKSRVKTASATIPIEVLRAASKQNVDRISAEAVEIVQRRNTMKVENLRHACVHCSENFKAPATLKQHMKDVHRIRTVAAARTNSEIWNYFTHTKVNGEKTATCNQCEARIPMLQASTTALHIHLQKKHGVKSNRQQSKLNWPIWKFIYSTDEKSYCLLCVSSKNSNASASLFATSSSVRRHMYRAHSDNASVCAVLNATRRSKSAATI